MKVKVISIFRDKFTGKLYRGGEVLEIEDESRVADLVGRGLAVAVEEKKEATKADANIALFDGEYGKKAIVEALKAIGEKATMNMKEETLLASVAALDEEKALELKEALA